MDLQSILRLASLFGQPQSMDQTNPSGVMAPPPTGMPQPSSQLPSMPSGGLSMPPPHNVMDLYQPRTAISQQYTDQLANMPVRQPIGPGRGLLGIASSALIGAKNPALGIESGNQIINAPYDRAMADWSTRAKALQAGATEEDRSNTNKRLLAEQTVAKEEAGVKEADAVKQRDVVNKQKDIALQTAKDRAATYQQRADVYSKLAQGGVLKTDKDGNDFLVKKDGTIEDLDKTNWTPAELLELRNKYSLQQIGARTQGQVTVEGVKEGNRQKDINTRVAGQKDVKQTPSAGSGASANDSESVVTVKDAKGNVTGTRTTSNIKNKDSLLKQKAIDYINALPPNSKGQKLQPSDANIKHAIDTGMVK
jgi:hypothetical protein